MLGKKTRDAALGFGCSLGFLLFVFKFNEIVQEYKARKRIRKNIVVEPGLHRTLMRIFKKACSKREVGTVIMLCTSLLLRTMGSVWVARHWGKMVKMLVTRNFRDMQRLVVQFAGTSVFLSILNALLKYYIAKLREEVREKITLWCHDKYMRKNDMIFYKANKVGDDKIEHCDHQVLSQSLKPIVDFIVYSVDLSRVQGLTTPLTLYGWFAIASCISTVSLPPYGELAAQEQRLEGMFRGVHSELITNCEQVAFLGGEVPEKDRLNESFARVLRHLSKTTAMNFNSEILRQYLNKYFVTVIGLFLVSRPYFSSTWKNMEAMSTSIQVGWGGAARQTLPGLSDCTAFARLFYHRPSFVVLDECTNGISPGTCPFHLQQLTSPADVEQEIYDRCTQMNLGIFSISHKIELKEFHDWELHYKGDSVGGWEMFKCSETRYNFSGKYMGNQSRGH
ncbi:hypothetical protein GUITHDRAFT_108382 [Guillardia theta CCMP2712]|uniref:ABC transmembrane type-1 domain-containing protein n=1 Tax=Guillardia theta (strain CCMP2712) TaxID=905079 RepID=L1JCA3_GUITC|nr:hypothetical protein GUITHDRAFT_108382 [Guillardia theta CCMP2712]EKX45932.1 hypothetical protein GUITHDRAFT_108382 [Guillardia theta CCMP2712]|eukprot:XP_005832912.1 hypothetical protein GUITHDRAFT_108382 [Guillardia theta CCMP2712]